MTPHQHQLYGITSAALVVLGTALLALAVAKGIWMSTLPLASIGLPGTALAFLGGVLFWWESGTEVVNSLADGQGDA